MSVSAPFRSSSTCARRTPRCAGGLGFEPFVAGDDASLGPEVEHDMSKAKAIAAKMERTVAHCVGDTSWPELGIWRAILGLSINGAYNPRYIAGTLRG